MASKFTPGPWHLHGENLDAEIEVVNSARSETICMVLPAAEAEGGAAYADARLIAAAPDLYAALKRARDMLQSVAGDIEDGFGLADMRGKYVLAILGARDDAHTALAKVTDKAEG